MADTLDDLAEALQGDDGPTRATSLRIPEALHRATTIAAALGMDPSFTTATTQALRGRVEAFLRQRAIAEHLVAHPEDEPTLATVAGRRVSGTGHVAETRPDLLAAVCDWYVERDPTWARDGRADAAVDAVLEHVEAVAAVEDTVARA